ncbi:MAG: right-handed parallel beta-helix repeat-containing protein, partial [Promethearchaeota archaeon]
YMNGRNGLWIHTLYWVGKLWGPADENVVYNNSIFQNSENGIALVNASYNLIDDNDLYCNGNSSACSPVSISDFSLKIQQIGGGNGVFMDPSNYNNITNNRIFNNIDNGIRMEDSDDNLIENNDIYGNGNNGGGSSQRISDLSLKILQIGGGNGVFMDPSNYNSLIGNEIFNNSNNGIRMEDSSYNVLEDNDIHDNGNNGGGSSQGISDISFSIQQVGGGNGVFMDPSDYNNITSNSIYNNYGDGITVINSSYNIIEDNDIYGNGNNGGGSSRGISDLSLKILQIGGGNGVFMDPSDYNTISRNHISHNNYNGIVLIDSDDSSVYDNIIVYNGLYGIYVHSGFSNQIYWNDFVANNLDGTSQAFDEGVESVFRHNYWDEWTYPDKEVEDGIVDEPYSIDGTANNYDATPFTTPHNPETLDMHLISRPRVLRPNGGEVSGTIIIEWAPATDFWGHTINYDIYYSQNNGESWDLIESGISKLRIRWDTTTVPDGSNYLIKVVAICSEGSQVEDISDSKFAVENGISPRVTSETSETTAESGSAPSWLLFLSAVSFIIIIKRHIRNKSLK